MLNFQCLAGGARPTALSAKSGVTQEWKGFRWDTSLCCAGFGHHHIFQVDSWFLAHLLSLMGWARFNLTKKDLGIIFSSPVTLDTEKIHCCAWLPWRAVSVAAGTLPSSWLQRWWWLYQQWLLEEVCQNSSWSRGPFLVFFPPIELSVRSSCKRHYCCSKKT